MTKQPEALRLAEMLEHFDWEYMSAMNAAAAELRRQHAEIEALRNHIHTCGPTCTKAGCVNARLHAEIEELLEALKRMRHWAEGDMVNYTGDHPVALARAAITAAEAAR